MRRVVGRVVRAHGIRGELSVEARTDEPRRRFAVGAVVWAGERALTVSASRPHQQRWLVTFAEVPDRTVAETLHGQLIEAEVDAGDRPDDPEEFYDHQLVGLAVHAADREVGRVTDVVHLPAQDLLVVDVDGTETFVPFVSDLVPTVDVAGGRVDVVDRPGLLDPRSAESDVADQDVP